MKYDRLIIEKKEYLLLKRFMNLSGYLKDKLIRNSMQTSMELLESAHIYDEKDMPSDVVRFNSLITVSSWKGWEKKFRLVIPTAGDALNSISILTPQGIAMMGHAEGDYFQWDHSPIGHLLKIEKVEQDNKEISISMVL